MTGSSTVSLRLPARPEAAGQARRSVRQTCPQIPAPILYDAELLTSEIVTNAIKHSSGILTIAIDCDQKYIAVAVVDNSPNRPTLNKAAASDIGGRGMRLVDRLAASWGCHPNNDGTGKVVWFRVAV